MSIRTPRHPDGFRTQRDPRPLAAPRQRSFDDVDTPLHDVMFCAVDLETTGGSAQTSEIVEIGAVKSKGGQVLGTFDVLVRPSVEIPVEIQLLTGIDSGMVREAAALPAVLPSFLEFCGGCVLVAHNARFDLSFLRTASDRLDYEDITLDVVDTAKLARRLLRDEVANCRLHTLARFFRTAHTPNHRAFPDAAACLEVLHSLLERAAAYGVTTLADLRELQKPRSNPHFEKVRIARGLPTGRGVYLFHNARGDVIYVGKAANLRARVRSYFTSDTRKRIRDLLREIDGVEVIACATDLEAQALEARLISKHKPRYNRRGVRRRAPVYLKLTAERHPRFSVVRTVRDEAGASYLGPFPTQRRAKAAAETASALFGIRTCTDRIGKQPQEPCALYDLGSCAGPCTMRPDDVAAHDAAVEDVRTDLAGGLRDARGRLATKLVRLVGQGRFEEASAHRDAFADLVRVVDRARTLAALAEAGRICLEMPEGRVSIDRGRIVADRDVDALFGSLATADEVPDDRHPLAPAADGLEERSVVGRWLEGARGLRLVSGEHPWTMPWPRPEPLERLEFDP